MSNQSQNQQFTLPQVKIREERARINQAFNEAVDVFEKAKNEFRKQSQELMSKCTHPKVKRTSLTKTCEDCDTFDVSGF